MRLLPSARMSKLSGLDVTMEKGERDYAAYLFKDVFLRKPEKARKLHSNALQKILQALEYNLSSTLGIAP